ncbi:MAG: 3-keto-5-aminohexanoate cleavage protein [Nitrospiraceae bacterium]|nr:3-keto-5-aminohexanoate cleavage protein [Nitrospiraceae bacterium]
MLQDLIINFAPTGMIPTKEMTPHVPVSVAEIVEDVHAACEQGITMVHLHARDPLSGRPTYKAEVYSAIIAGIRRFAPELIVCVSLSGRDFSAFEQRAEPLDLDGGLKPDMGSLTLSSVNFNKQASVNEPAMIQALAARMQERGISPELEAFDIGMINYAHYLEKKALISPPHYFNLLLGNIACAQADLMHAGIMIRDLPAESLWSLAGIGDSQLPMNSVAIAIGAGVRVGLEDHIFLDQGRTRLARNIDLVRRIHRLAGDHDRAVMSPRMLRSFLNLEAGNGLYGRKGPHPEIHRRPMRELPVSRQMH